MKKITTLLSFILIIALNSFASGVGGTAEPLSLGLLSFSGYVKGSQVVLEWEAMMWATSRVFTLERSPDGIVWTKIKEIPAQTAGGANAYYTVADEAPLNGTGYYRVGLSNDMGEQAVSSPVRIYMEGRAAGLSIWPNPCSDAVQLGNISSGSMIVVRNASGVEMFRSSSDERTSISTGSWLPGVYFVSVAMPDGQLLQSRLVRR